MMKTAHQITFSLGEKEYTVSVADVTPNTSLNTYLRDHLHLTGTKKMCAEGGCGACLVAVERVIDGKTRTFSVNSCLVPMLSCNGWKIETIEAIGNPLKGYDKIQKILAENDGTQCGFCSNGMVMNMYALNKDGGKTMAEIEDSFGGNICRCTGYRPILTAFKKLATDSPDKESDIEDMQSLSCSKPNCCKNCPKAPQAAPESFSLDLQDAKWIKVYNLEDLLKTIYQTGNKSYRLVAGNTARGVYRRPPSVDFYIDVNNVSELVEWKLALSTLSLGGNKTLNRTLEIFRNVSQKSSWQYLATMADHIDLIAGFSIRNTATLAGNLMIKHEHNEFPSDLFLILETFNATLVLVDTRKKESRVTPMQFLSKDMNKLVLKAIELPKMELPEQYKYATYKIMPRAQNAHAMVNAGFLIKLSSNNIVESANIVYGGINSKFIHASKTENYLKGKNVFTNDVIQGALKMLDSEIVPTESPPDSSAKYRKGLSLSLFYKFILKVAPSDLVNKRFSSGGNMIERPVSTAIQEYGTNKEFYPVGKPVHKVEGLAQTSGQAQYITDMPDLPNQLHAAFVLTDAIANSTVVSVDTSEAMKLEGVVAILTAKDIPGDNNFTPSEVAMSVNEKILCDGTVEYHSQPIAIVCADNFSKAQKAARLVKITYKAPTSQPYLTIDEVINGGDATKDRIIQSASLDPNEKGTDTTKVIKGTYYMGRQFAFHMELQCCNAVPTENDGLDVYPSSQWLDHVQISIGKALKIPMSKINLFVRRLGGAFGSKITRNSSTSTAVALAAYKLKRPVKMWVPMESNMKIYGNRMPLKMNYEIGVNGEGVIQYLDAKYYSDYGIGVGNDYMYPYLTGLIGHCYKKERWGYKTYNVKTDTATNCYVRAPGSAEGMGSTEAIMDHISYTLNLDPWDVRMANYDETNYPMIKSFFEQMKTWGEIDRRKEAVATFNKENRWRKKGLSIIPMAWEFLLWPKYSVLVSIFHGDGTVAISHGGVEIGQGINTKVIQACAYKLGIDMDMISVQPSYSVISANAFATGLSTTTEVVVSNTLKACEELLSRMEATKKTMTNPTWVELVQKCYNSNINLTYSSLDIPDYSSYTIYGMCATEVEIDVLTGQKLVSRVDILEDIGESLSPLIDMGQVEGAFVMGMGYYTQEEIIFSDEGEVLTNRTWNYKPPGAKDIPLNFRIKFPENNPNPVGVLKSKAVSEPPLCLTISVPLAMRRALAAARLEADSTQSSWIPFDGPTTTERTFLYALNSYEQYVLK